MNKSSLALLILVMALITIGCSSTPVNPILTTGHSEETPREAYSSRVLWGLWNITFDPVTMEIHNEPARDLQAHFNVADMIVPPACDDCFAVAVNSFDPVTRILDVDVTLRNPTHINGRDVRGILHTNDYGHLLTNPDNWTDLWDMPGGDTINPFIAFAKTEPDRIFAGLAEHTENYLVYIPMPPAYFAITFAVDASWPGNCKEPYMIGEPHLDGELYQYTNAAADLYVDVFDWQDDVESVQVSALVIAGEEFVDCTLQSGTTWTCELANALAAPSGEYIIVIKATSFSTSLYHLATITITETAGPVVSAIDPTSAEQGTLLDNLKITGSGFIYGFDVELRMDPEPPIIGEGEWIFTTTTCYVDFNIPPSAEPGLYDVAFTNGDGKQTVGLDMFEVTAVPATGWARTWGGTGEEGVGGVAVDEDGYSYVTGYFSGTTDFDPGPGTINMDSSGGKDFFIYKFDTSGNPVWFWVVGGTDDDAGMDIALDDSGNIYVVGYFNDTVDFDPGGGVDEHSEPGGMYDPQSFLTVYDTNGNYMTTWSWGSQWYDIPKGIALDAANNIYITGETESQIDLDPDPTDEDIQTVGEEISCYLIKLDSTGDYQWGHVWGGTTFDWPDDVDVDDAGNVYTAGRFRQNIDFDPDPADEYFLGVNEIHSFLTKFDTDGDFQWARDFGAAASTNKWSEAYGVAVEPGGGYVYLTGFFEGTNIDFNPDPVGEDPRTSEGVSDGYILKLDSAGDYVWCGTWGGEGFDDSHGGVAINNLGDVFICGSYSGTTDLDPDIFDYENYVCSGERDIFIIKLDSTCDFIWGNVIGGTSWDDAQGIATNSSGMSWMTGYFMEDEVDFDPDYFGMEEHTSAGAEDIFLVKYLPNGLWAE